MSPLMPILQCFLVNLPSRTADDASALLASSLVRSFEDVDDVTALMLSMENTSLTTEVERVLSQFDSATKASSPAPSPSACKFYTPSPRACANAFAIFALVRLTREIWPSLVASVVFPSEPLDLEYLFDESGLLLIFRYVFLQICIYEMVIVLFGTLRASGVCDEHLIVTALAKLQDIPSIVHLVQFGPLDSIIGFVPIGTITLIFYGSFLDTSFSPLDAQQVHLAKFGGLTLASFTDKGVPDFNRFARALLTVSQAALDSLFPPSFADIYRALENTAPGSTSFFSPESFGGFAFSA